MISKRHRSKRRQEPTQNNDEIGIAVIRDDEDHKVHHRNFLSRLLQEKISVTVSLRSILLFGACAYISFFWTKQAKTNPLVNESSITKNSTQVSISHQELVIEDEGDDHTQCTFQKVQKPLSIVFLFHLLSLAFLSSTHFTYSCITIAGGIWMAPSSLTPYPGVSFNCYFLFLLAIDFFLSKNAHSRSLFCSPYNKQTVPKVWHLYDAKDQTQGIDSPCPGRGDDSNTRSLSNEGHAIAKRTKIVVGQHFWKCT